MSLISLSEEYLRKRVKALRKRSELTVAELADLMGCSKSWISKIENGRLSISSDYLERLASSLGLSGIEREALFDIDAWNYREEDSLTRIAERLCLLS
jgi:transcriptional regulator with XRE-family HTH domain